MYFYLCNFLEYFNSSASRQENGIIIMTNTHDKLYSMHWWMSFTVTRTTTRTIRHVIREWGGQAKAVTGGCSCGEWVSLWSILWAVAYLSSSTLFESSASFRITAKTHTHTHTHTQIDRQHLTNSSVIWTKKTLHYIPYCLRSKVHKTRHEV